MIVRVYNFLSEEKPKFSQNLVGIVSDVTNFKYTRRAYDIGSFEMTIPTHADETDCIQPDRMLIVGEKIKQTYIDGDPTKRIVVGTFLYVTDVEKKDDTITVTGYDLKYLFALRVTLFPKEEQDKGTYGYYVTSGTTFSCISDIINYNIVNTTDSDRQIYGLFGITMPVNQINADPPLTGIQDDRYMTRLEPVSTAIFNLLKNCKTHFYDMRLIIDDNAEDGDSYNPHMESSEDKPTIIIDESRYNIKSYTRKDGTSAYKNAIYAVVGSGDAVTVKCVKRPDDTASGVKRKEVVLDVDTDSVAEIDRYALKAAEEYVISDDFEIEPLFMDDEAEPELAQKVSIRIDGVEYETVITEITDEYANGKHIQSYVCGDKKLKVLNVLNKATAGNTQKIVNNKIAMGNKTGVGVFVNYDRTSEIFNDYNRNTASGNYSHVEGYKNNLKSEGAAHSWATHIEGQENTEASRTSCPSDKKASNNHIEGKLNSSYGRINHVEGVNCFAEYDTQCCHVEGSNSRVSEGAKVAHAEGKDCVAGNECSHAEGKSAQATGYASHAEGGSCTANGNYSHAEGLSSEASGKCSHAEGEVNIASGNHSHAEGWSNIASGECSHASGKDNTASGDFSIASGGGSEATGTYAIAHGLACTAGDNSVAIGTRVQAANGCVAFGKYNKTTDALFVIGSGTSTSDGKIKAADALVIDHDGNLHIPGKVTADGGVEEIASSTKAGIVKISRDFEISEDGTLSIVKGGTFPPATQTTLGGVIVGQGFSVSDDGFLTLLLSHSLTINKWHQIDVYGASNTSAGIVKIGSGITAEYQRNEDTGMLITKISVQPATAQEAGIVKVGEGLSVEADGTLNADIYPPASLFLSGASKMMLHKYIPVESKKQGYYYGSVASDIICDTVKYCSSVPEFPESYIVIPNWYSSASASATVTSNAAFELTKPTINNDESTFTVKVVCKELNFSSSVYSATNFYNTTIYLKWNNIKEPTDKFPNGYITCEVRLYYCDTSGTPQDRRVRSGCIPFASKAEYNAAICLTATELSTFDLSEEKYTLLVPNSLCLLSGKLPSTELAEEGMIYLIPNENNTAFKQYMWNGTEYKYVGETDHKADLSEYLKSTDISAWAKAATKPTYTAKEVGAATAADIAAAVNAVSIGGRNIITGTAEAVIGYGGHSKGHWRKYGTAGTIQTVDITDTPISCVSKGIRLTSTDENSQIICGQDDIPLNSGMIYTFSCWIRSNSAEGVPCRLQPFYKSTTDHSGNTQDIIISDEWQYISFTAKFSPQSAGTYSGARIYLQPTAAGNYIEVCAMKLEAGNKPTDWSPAPEDAERRITSLEARVAALEAAAVSGGEV